MEIPKGWGVQTKKPSEGGVWIFSGSTHLPLPFFPEGREIEQANLQKFKCPGACPGGCPGGGC